LLGDKQFEVEASPGSGLDKFQVAFFAASCDDAVTMKKFAESLKLDYPILSDPGKQVATAYGVVHGIRQVPERWTYFIAADGTVAAIDKEVKTKTHGADIAKKLAELGVPKK
jgi:peroxiredoxin Q/BCP